jgi:phenylalanyl-tRNA synthetase beta chain
MKISLNWLGLFVDLSGVRTQYDSREMAHQYSIHTASIEGIGQSKRFDGVVVGKVLTAERHPESSKLWICQVDVGGGERIFRAGLHGYYHCKPDDSMVDTEQILTGAPNVYPGMYTPVAVVGCQLAPDFIIGERKMAGMTSRGMMCGADEIGLSNSSSGGIMDLNLDYAVGYLDSVVGKPFFDLTVPVL